MSSRTSVSATSQATNPEDGVKYTAANADVSNGNKFTNTGKELLLVTNTDAASHTVTYTRTVRGEAVTKTRTIPAGETWVFGPFPLDYNTHEGDADVNQVWFTANGSSGHVTMMVLKLP